MSIFPRWILSNITGVMMINAIAIVIQFICKIGNLVYLELITALSRFIYPKKLKMQKTMKIKNVL
jgi:hypothetical protein